MTKRDIDDFLMWSSLIVYLIIWIGLPYYFLGAELWYIGVVWAVTYVFFHIFEITMRGHCYLSADSTAFPAVLVVAIILTSFLHMIDVVPFTGLQMVDYFKAFGSSFMLGHVSAIAYSALFHWVLTACFRRD